MRMNAADKKTIIDVVTMVVNQMTNHVRQEIKIDIAAVIEQHRRAVWAKDEWCCKEMVSFAKEVWDIPNPPKRELTEFGQIKLQIRGRYVNYCPFCGVKA